MRRSCVLLFLVSIFYSFCLAQTLPIDLRSQKWFGYAICYSGYREGQDPDKGAHPSQQQVAEDLKILEKHFSIIRTYGSGQHSKDVLSVIRRENLKLKVMLGAWLAAEPGNEKANEAEIDSCIHLANEYKGIVIAVSVGNEILVDWSNHKVPEEKVIAYVKKVRANVSVPVTVDDDFMGWIKNAKKLSKEVDFISTHMYPVWGGHDIDSGLAVTVKLYNMVKSEYPDKTVHIGEAGWATYTVGELHAPRAGDEAKQKRYFKEISDWSKLNNITVFFFEAFDEPWKGEGTEGHWGIFSVGRKSKPVMLEWYPALKSEEPTSPMYEKAK